jgi:5'(3')-deoxyribonucleotidase
MDSILAEFLGHLLLQYNRQTGEDVKMEDITDWDIMKFVQKPEVMKGLFREPGFFYGIPVVPGATWAMRTLSEEKLPTGEPAYEIVILSSPCTSHSAAEKIDWMRDHFPFLDQKKVFLGHEKYMVKGDFLIDDGPHNARAYRAEWPGAGIYTIAYPYNDDPAYHGRFGSPSNMQLGWFEIVNAIRKRSR